MAEAAAPHWDFPDGAQFRDKVTGKLLEIHNGQPVVVGSDAFDEPATKATDVKTLNDLGSQLQAMDELHQHAQQFMAENRAQGAIGTSPFLAPDSPAPTEGHGLGDAIAQPFRELGAYAGKVANPVNWDPHLNAMQAQTIPMATAMRAPGMRMTQMEFNAFRGAAPSVSRTLEANEELAKNIAAAHTYVTAKHAFYTSWKQQHGNLDGVDAPWEAFKASRFDSAGNYKGPPKAGAAPTPRAAANQTLIARSAAAKAPPVVDIDGNPVSP